MKKALCRSLILALGVTLVASAAFARNASKGLAKYDRQQSSTVTLTHPDLDPELQGLASSAAQGTTNLYGPQKFEVGASCTAAGWTTVDITAQTGNYMQVHDFVANPLAGYAAIQGNKSLWCGTVPSGSPILCGYSDLPGYGNTWNQAWCTKTCVAIADGPDVDSDADLGVAFKAKFDSEPDYDATTLEYTTDCTAPFTGYSVLDGGIGVWDGLIPAITIAQDYNIPGAASVKVRLRFQSDGAWSDQDGNWPTDGAAIFDSLSVEGGSVEDFEGELHNATSSNDWQICTPSGFGNALALFPGAAQVQQDPCAKNLLCLWAALLGTSENYSCGGFPAQPAVPKHNAEGQYLSNEIWSPNIPIAGTGAVVNLEFWAYRDLPLINLVFYIWHVRTVVAGCPGAWEDLNFVYYGGQKDWFRNVSAVGALLNLAGGSDINIALGVIDQCGVWCGQYGNGLCHSHAPLLDRVRLYRVASSGPQWLIRDIDQFQDNFADDGTLTGWCRADMARDILPGTNLNIIPGDTSVVQVADPVSGLADDLVNGGKKIYIYLATWPFQSAKTGTALTQDPSRFPWVGSVSIGGVTWDCIRLDQAILNGNPVADTYCIDLNDCLWTPCDTVCFFYCAENTAGVTTYAFGSNLGGSTTDINEAAANPSEFTCLPAGGWKRGGDILYVDGMDGRGSQPFFDTAFEQLALDGLVDRYDVRGPSSGVSNRLDGRVQDVEVQLLDCYLKIIWDCGDLSVTLGEGNAIPEKTDDYQLLIDFLDNLANPGGVYIGGDDVAEQLAAYALSGVTFRTDWLSYTLTTGNHRPAHGITPKGTHVVGFCFSDSFWIFGGCPLLNDFDVMAPGSSAQMEMTYNANTGTNGAVISQVSNNSNGVDVGVIMSGFSFIYIRDDESDGFMDRAVFLRAILLWLQNLIPQPTPTGTVAKNSLSQNYPNPFNPQTTIAFSVKDRAHVSLKVYNVAGQLVRTLLDDSFAAGPHKKVWDGRNDAGQQVSSGVYFYKLVTSDFSQTKKMVLLK
jgi:hypothetical protein